MNTQPPIEPKTIQDMAKTQSPEQKKLKFSNKCQPDCECTCGAKK
jgi:hypothetical protein